MNYELTILRGISACKKQLAQLNKQCMEFALNTFSSQCSGGTYAQAVSLAELVLKRNRLQNYLDAVFQVFLQMPKGYGALLKAVYVKRIPRETLATKYNVSLSTVYRKLAKARSSFKSKMDSLPQYVVPQELIEYLVGNDNP